MPVGKYGNYHHCRTQHHSLSQWLCENEMCCQGYRTVQETRRTTQIRLDCDHNCAHPSHCDDSSLLMSRDPHNERRPARSSRCLVHIGWVLQLPSLCTWSRWHHWHVQLDSGNLRRHFFARYVSCIFAQVTRWRNGQCVELAIKRSWVRFAVGPLSSYLGQLTGAEYGECVERESITGVWRQSPQRDPGADPPCWNLFVYFHTKRAKSLVIKLKKTPMFGPWRAAARTAHTWSRQCQLSLPSLRGR